MKKISIILLILLSASCSINEPNNCGEITKIIHSYTQSPRIIVNGESHNITWEEYRRLKIHDIYCIKK